MAAAEALVSIGMPVLNGERYIDQALDSLLSQSYRMFELNICDNASTDQTAEICRSYRLRDERIRYYRNPTNLGMLPNWRRTLDLASGEFFMWAAYDDKFSANYIAELVECLRLNPGAVLAAGKTVYVDEGNNIRPDMDADNAPRRRSGENLVTAKQLLQEHAHNWLHGLYRREAMLGLPPTFFTENAWGSDVLFLLETCLSHEVIGSQRAIMYKRVERSRSQAGAPKTPRARVKLQCRNTVSLLRVIFRSSISRREKIEMVHAVLLYLKWLYFRKGVYSWMKLWAKASYQILREDCRSQ
jgi:glycosyltransferase involved in cell wall biosynthesis